MVPILVAIHCNDYDFKVVSHVRFSDTNFNGHDGDVISIDNGFHFETFVQDFDTQCRHDEYPIFGLHAGIRGICYIFSQLPR